MSESSTYPITHHNKAWLAVRSLVFWVVMIVNTVVMGAPVLLASLISFNLGYFFIHFWLWMNLYSLRVICGVTWKVDGAENIPDKPCLVLSKHQSTWETYFLPMKLPRAVYVAKKSLRWIPIFGWALWAIRFILIDRSSGRTAINQMVEQGRDRLARGRWIVIFPEGTRRPVGAEPNYRIGGAVLAEQAEADILPVATNSGEFWPRMGFIKWPGEITVSFGPVIKADGRNAQELLQATEAWIEGRMAEITVTNRFPY